ncbi:MAG: DUF6677 family protein [Planctomycetota bacterium]
MTKTAIDPAKGLGLGTFFAGFVPGLLQFRLGLASLGVTALASCTVLFFCGWALVGERLFYWGLAVPDTKPEAGLFASSIARYGLGILPELMNLPANLVGAMLAFDGTPTGLRLQRMPGSWEHLGGWLTGASGMLAAFWSAHGHFEMRLRRDAVAGAASAVEPSAAGSALPRPPAAPPGLCAALSWLLPGLGHARAGQKDKGMLMGIAVVTVFALGLFFSGGHAVDRANYSVWWIGQNLFGGGSLFASLVTGPMRMESLPIDLDLGTILCTVAGLMNLVVMCDAFTVAERSVFPVVGAAGAGSGPAASNIPPATPPATPPGAVSDSGSEPGSSTATGEASA